MAKRNPIGQRNIGKKIESPGSTVRVSLYIKLTLNTINKTGIKIDINVPILFFPTIIPSFLIKIIYIYGSGPNI